MFTTYHYYGFAALQAAARPLTSMAYKRREHDFDFDVPWRLVDEEFAHALDDDEDSEQHKRRRNQKLKKQSIRHYRHATGKWGAALESFKPIWVRCHNFFFTIAY